MNTSRVACRGFTLIEILLALGILALLGVLMVSMLGNVSSAWTRSRERMDNLSQGRALLGHLQRSVQSAVIRQDLSAFLGNEFAFYTRETLGDRPLTYVSYHLDTRNGRSIMVRTETPFSYGSNLDWKRFDAEGIQPNGSVRLVAEGIYAFSHTFIKADGSESPTFETGVDVTGKFRPEHASRALKVSIAVVSEQAEELLEHTGGMSQLEAALQESAASSSAKDEWDLALDQAGFPPNIRAGIRTFERLIPLNYTVYDIPVASVSSP